ncbi:hypothetical protein IQ07DRAFT_424261 [Pyrenochaeta sp. DS3sAY3a]|nr:hypothetical protein IQ07DRAFT_424261 [Pyrenochaeta sp. DS3sAY3a]
MELFGHNDSGNFSLIQLPDEAIPLFAILSHALDIEKVTFEDLTNGTIKDKPSYGTVRFCGEQASQHVHDSSEAEEPWVLYSNITCSTALSDKTSVFSAPSENDPAAGAEISNHSNSSPSTPQSSQGVPLLRMGQILLANAHESCEPDLQNNGPVTPGFEDSHLSVNGRVDGGYGDQEFPTFGKHTANSEEAILAKYETSALRDFMDDSSHQYWTWCKEQQNWWHEDEKTNAMIWAPLDFD